MNLPDKADGGQQMIDAFAPTMDEDDVKKTSNYYSDVFVPLGDVAHALSQKNNDRFNGYLAGFDALGVDAENMVPTLSQAMGMPEADVQAFMGEQFSAMSQTLQGFPQMGVDFSGPLGLKGANVGIFEQCLLGLTATSQW